MDESKLLERAMHDGELNRDEACWLYKNASLPALMFTAHEIRKKIVPGDEVSYIIDRNVNITNVCVAQCKFCNFYRKPGEAGGYITSVDAYKEKIDALYQLGGRQLLLQGGLNPRLSLDDYKELFVTLKKLYPDLKLHALSPTEIVYIAQREKMTYREVLAELITAGLDSLPGGGAEILCDRVRGSISPVKARADEWLDVMREAHKMHLITTATMMFGHIETVDERIDHILKIRDVQNEKPSGATGFIAFIPWPFQRKGTRLFKEVVDIPEITPVEYVRLLSLSRILLNNIPNIQASWLTVGKETAQLCLHAGANDFGSVMIEENVVSSAGAEHKFDIQGMKAAIKEAGYEPVLRNQLYGRLEGWEVEKVGRLRSL